MFCLLPTKCKQQQIALLIISFFLYVNGIRNEGSNMLLLQQPLRTTIENSNYQSDSPSKAIFKPSPLLEFTLDDASLPQQFKPTHEAAKYPTYIPSTPSTPDSSTPYIKEGLAMKTETPNDNRRYSPSYATNAGEQQFLFPNEQQQQGLGFMPPQQQQSQYQQQPLYQNQQQQQQQYQQEQHFAQQLTEMPIYIYKDPYTNENYHYTPTEANSVDLAASAAPAAPNNYNGYKQQQPVQQQQYQPAAALQDNQEYLVHSSMIVGTHHQQKPPSPYYSSDKDVYLKRPGLVYDESYIAHPNSVLEKKSESGQATKANKISYDSHDYPPPSYHEQQTSNFLPTPVPDVPATSRPTSPPVRRPQVYATPPPPPVRQPPSYATSRPPSLPPPQQDYRPRPPPPQQAALFGHQQYLQSSQNALPNYANNLDNYLSNKQQTEYYRPERPPAYLQQQQQQQQQFYETIPPPFRQQQQQYQQSPYPPYRPQQQQQPSQQSHSPFPFENPQYAPQRPPPSRRPSYNNYYDYQIGEVPPQTQGAFNYPYPRPPNGPYRPPPAPPTQQPSGLATLVQYAPQFTSLLLGGGGGGGSSANSNSPLGSLLGALTGGGGGATTPQSSSSLPSSSYNRRPVNSQLIKALENIARNDDLQCVPKVLCQMIAAQTERGQLPSFITSPAITNFLSGFPASSPALIYGRAALLGLSGGDKSCHHTYVKCPKNEIEIIYYLNNHRGGFFKFFSEPEPEQSVNGNHDSSQSGGASLFSILSALTGNQAEPATTPRPRPKPQPQPPSSDITSTIGNFFTQLLSDSMGVGATVEYQRRRRRSAADKRIRFEDEDAEDDEHFSFKQQTDEEEYQQDDEEDSEDTQQNVEFVYEPEYTDDENDNKEDTRSRVVHRPTHKENRLKFFPETDSYGGGHATTEDELTALIDKFNEFNRGRKLKFPSATKERQYTNVLKDNIREAKDLDFVGNGEQLNYGHQYTNYQEGTYDNANSSKKVKFRDDDQETAQSSLYQKEMADLITAESSHAVGTKVKFPDREGKILNRPYYASSFSYNHQLQQQQHSYSGADDKFVVPNNQRPKDYSDRDLPNNNGYDTPLKSGKDDKLELPNSQKPGHYINQPQGNDDYDEFGQPHIAEDYNPYGQTQSDYNRFGPGIYNTHVTSLNSINNYVSNSATNNNYYGGLPLKQPITSSNHFLPTPPPEIDNDYNNSLYPNNNFNANNENFNNRYSSSNAHKSQRYTDSSNNKYNRQTYSATYRPLRKPSSSNSQSNNSYSSAKLQDSNNNSAYNRYHSSLYTTRRTTTTPRPKDDNVYVTNSRGETEYYIRPDGRKVYL